ncbi:hypothetical protein [Novosphingopyxis sp.]|uniref:hypothetical protein n=1 Tax=Novosphingopyxis sp. TaxID=2709690 RepID=UPI003B5CABCC
MSSHPPRSHTSAPNARLVDFDEAVIKTGPMGDTRFLRVRGTLSDDGVAVKLAPRIYSRKPDYWVIEVAAITARDGAERAFEISIPVDAVTGIKGIVVRGETREDVIEN